MTKAESRILVAGLWIVCSAAVPTMGQQPTLDTLQKMDTNADGRLSYEEISKGFNANQPRLLAGFKKRDANGNGKIDKGEVPAIRLARMDLNKNGSVTSEEFLVGSSNQAREFVLRADVNRDGYVTSDELGHGVKQTVSGADASYEEISASYYQNPARRKRLFTMLDADKSGSIEAGEWPDPDSFAAVDASHDGRINDKEFMAAHAHVTVAVVSAVDLNKDGRVSVAELRRRRK